MVIHLKIGGYAIHLREVQNRRADNWPFWPFDLFESDEKTADIRLDIRVTQKLPDIQRGNLCFDACHGLWSLYEHASGFLLESLRTDDHSLYTRSILSRDYSKAEVWVLEGKGGGWVPAQILNPIMEFCLNTRLALDGGLLLHAAGALTRQGAWVFMGPSGAGKSTISDFLSSRGECILSDEKIILRRTGARFLAYGTPWPGTGRIAHARQGELARVYCIRHGSLGHSASSQSARAAVPLILKQCFLPYWDREAMDRTLLTIGTLVNHVPCLDLAFLNAQDVVDYLRGADEKTLRR